MLWMGGILLFISSIHRIVFAYGGGERYVNELFVSAIMISFVLFTLLIAMYIPLLIFFSIKDKKIKWFIYHILLLIFCIIILIIALCIDAPTLIYMT